MMVRVSSRMFWVKFIWSTIMFFNYPRLVFTRTLNVGLIGWKVQKFRKLFT